MKRFGRGPDGWAVLGRTHKFAPRALKNLMVEQLFVGDELVAVCVVSLDSNKSAENTGVRVWIGGFFGSTCESLPGSVQFDTLGIL